MSQLKVGSDIKIEYGGSAKVVKEIGRGGQGIVYLVEYNGQQYALKWYFYNKLDKPQEFRANLEHNIKDESPSKNFLWPEYMTEGIQYDSFGYLMKLIPDEYEQFTDILNTYKIEKSNDITVTNKISVKFKSVEALINAALNIVTAFRDLHRVGKSYQDLNDGGFYINVETGDILVCDCDNIAPEGENFGIAGMPGYMAPEIVRGIAKPDVQTDKYSLAVVLFKLLFRGDPLEGAKVLQSVCLHEEADLKHYGKEPVFIFDPHDKSNRPVKGVHDSVVKLWKGYPDFIHDAFIKSFTEGIKNPNNRIIENEWKEILVNLRSNIISCTCGISTFSNIFTKEDNNFVCPKCGKKFNIINFDKVSIPIFAGQKIYKCFTSKSEDFETITGRFIENKKYKGIIGLKNLSTESWKIINSQGEKIQLEPGKTVVIRNDMHIEFSNHIKSSI